MMINNHNRMNQELITFNRKIYLIILIFIIFSVFTLKVNSTHSYVEFLDPKELELSFYKVQNCFLKSKHQRIQTRKFATFNEFKYPVIVLNGIIDEVDYNNLILLNSCIKEKMPSHFMSRPFTDEGVYAGGNDVTFVNEFIQAVIPDLMDHILNSIASATEKFGWLPHPFHLGIRCTEILEYNGAGSELLWHIDNDSIYTISIVLSDPSDVTGGNFLIYDDSIPTVEATSKSIEISPPRFGGLIFDSETFHAVSKIANGTRMVLVLELWPYQDAKYWEFRNNGTDSSLVFKVPKMLRIPPPIFTCPADQGDKQVSKYSNNSANSSLITSSKVSTAIQETICSVNVTTKSSKNITSEKTSDISNKLSASEKYALLDGEANLRDLLMICIGILCGLILGVTILAVEDFFLYSRKNAFIRNAHKKMKSSNKGKTCGSINSSMDDYDASNNNNLQNDLYESDAQSRDRSSNHSAINSSSNVINNLYTDVLTTVNALSTKKRKNVDNKK